MEKHLKYNSLEKKNKMDVTLVIKFLKFHITCEQ